MQTADLHTLPTDDWVGNVRVSSSWGQPVVFVVIELNQFVQVMDTTTAATH